MGDQLDVNMVCDDKQKIKGWVQATITRIEGDLLSLVFPELTVDYDHDLERWSTDIAEFESRTKEDYAWRREHLNREDLADYIVDVHDKFKWEEGTIFSTFIDNTGGRPVTMANVGFRVYRSEGKKIRQDEKGVYDGWSNKYDEDIPLFCARIQ